MDTLTYMNCLFHCTNDELYQVYINGKQEFDKMLLPKRMSIFIKELALEKLDIGKSEVFFEWLHKNESREVWLKFFNVLTYKGYVGIVARFRFEAAKILVNEQKRKMVYDVSGALPAATTDVDALNDTEVVHYLEHIYDDGMMQTST